MTTRTDLEEILKREASVPKPQIEGVIDAMVAAYNRGIEDSHDNVAESEEAYCRLVKDWDDRLLGLRL